MNEKSKCYPILPLRDIVIFPSMIAPLFVGRKKSVRALEAVMQNNKEILLSTQVDSSENNPQQENIHSIGVISSILQLLKLPDGTVKVLVEGKKRARINTYTDCSDYFEASADILESTCVDEPAVTALQRSISQEFKRYIKLNKDIPSEVLKAVEQCDDADNLSDIISAHLNIKVDQKQELLKILNLGKRLEYIYSLMHKELLVLKADNKIKSRVKSQMERTHREYYLNEQIKAIQKELGNGDDGNDEFMELEQKISKTKLSKEAKEKAQSELKKLRTMPSMSAEATVVRNYLDWILSIPWGKKSRLKKNLHRAQKVLDADHYGLGKVKERIIEYLAVQQRSRKQKSPILCLVGPPGVGKTSLGKSVARATGREFIRISLGGVHDESEIRGHRRTYIGSMPGRIIQSMKKAKTNNPLILLDEIDKTGYNMRGDPANALLEVLDPEQNSTFVDHYLEIEYDLSQVMFLTTSNSYNIPSPLLDRMEVIRLSSYTEYEKQEIAKRHLLNKQMKNHALKKTEFNLENNALRDIIRYYTREAGVRNLEREIAKLCRKAVTQIVKRVDKSVHVSSQNLASFLGVRQFKFGLTEAKNRVGVVTGLAYTSVGGELLSIEALKLPGKGRMKTTGKLGDVMKESIEAASSYARSISLDIGVKPNLFEKIDIHVHIPEGATPKDGPSAGIGMVTAIVSVLSNIAVNKDVAMTGEITLRGTVLPIGGLKEKLLAALRGQVKTVLIPEENIKDLSEIPDNVKADLNIIAVNNIREVLKFALSKPLKPIKWDAVTEDIATQRIKNTNQAPLTH